MIQLDENYRINTEDNNNCILEFFEIRTKNKDTEKEKQFEYVEQWFYPSILTCLTKYLSLVQKEATSIEQVIEKTNLAEKNITELVRNLSISK